jgi:Monooxygenase af470-like
MSRTLRLANLGEKVASNETKMSQAAPKIKGWTPFSPPLLPRRGPQVLRWLKETNHMTTEVIPQRMTARVGGDFCLFLIGMRINRPLKIHKWLPVMRAMGRMIPELQAHPELGFLDGRFCSGAPLFRCSTGARLST